MGRFLISPRHPTGLILVSVPLLICTSTPLKAGRPIAGGTYSQRCMKADERTQIAFGKALRKNREAVAISQEELAARAGMNRTYVGDVERGERNVSIVNMQKLAKALKVNLSVIVAEMESLQGRTVK